MVPVSLCDIHTKDFGFPSPIPAWLDTASIFCLDHSSLLPPTVCFLSMFEFCQKLLVHLCRPSATLFWLLAHSHELFLSLEEVILENQQDAIMSIGCLISQSKDIPKIIFTLYVLNSEKRRRLVYFFLLLN